MFPIDVLALLLAACAVLPAMGLGIPAPAHFYPYGNDTGDTMLAQADISSSGEIQLSRPFPFYGIHHNQAWVNTDGIVSFIWDTLMLFGEIPIDPERIIAPFAVDLDTTRNNGRVYYRQTNDNVILQRATKNVRKSFSDASGFSADWAFIVSYHKVTYFSGTSTSPVTTFQVVLITNGVESYAMFNYGDVQFAKEPYDIGYAQMGFGKGDMTNYYVLPDSYKAAAENVELTTNVGVLGRWVFRVDGDTIVPGGIFPEGVYDCVDNSPCTKANRALGKYFFAYIDMSKYVRCDAWGHCWVRACSAGTLFEASISTCAHS